ncbi:Bifunctional inhibitor/lipid-transfer protein/seed storage 2S albumin superfamily protein [Perilla frutescens var. frutescens]|nr:Bifunctional inhibitor/lipid-transfer protein/seed storage 2S albumin superfamily protein [Perilla frutescens var. frutescens]
MAAPLFTFPLLLCMLFSSSAAHSAPAPAPDCSILVGNMVDCLSYVTAGGTAAKPEGTCCSGLKTVVKTDPHCLCDAFNNSAQLGVTLNLTKALALPAACHVSAPSLSNCALSTGIGAAPALSPSSIGAPPTTSIAGNEGAPAPSLGSSGSSALTSSLEFLLLMAVAVVTSFALF